MSSFDHIPTPAELAESYSQSSSDDPRSIYYKRKLVRPKLPIVRIVLFITVVVTISLVSAILVARWAGSTLWGSFSGVLVFVLLCVIFAKSILITLVKIYQAVAPAKLRERCRYEPSCSEYMILALQKYGVCKGVKKGLKRWRGCKPPNGGYDLP